MSFFGAAPIIQSTPPKAYGSLSATAMIIGQVETITLTDPIAGPPIIYATKSVPQTGLINSSWDATASKYLLHDTALATTMTPSATTGTVTLTLGVGSFAAGDVGKTITGNGGVAVILTTTTAKVTTDFTNTSAIASGSWTMESIVIDGTGLGISNYLEFYSIANGVFDSKTIDVTTQDTSPTSFYIKPDGTVLYVVGKTNDDVYQYTMSTAWDVSTATYDTVSFSIGIQETNPSGLQFKPDGTKMYIVGTTGDDINQYSLSSVWDLSTSSFDSVSFSVSGQDTSPQDLYIKPDGTTMYILGYSNDTVFQYTLSSAWDMSTASYDSVSLVIGAQEGLPQGLTFNDSGTKMFMVGSNINNVHQYTLSTEWDLSTASYDTVSYGVTGSYGVRFSTDGSKMYTLDIGGDVIYQYSTTGSQVAPISAYTSLITSGTGQIDTSSWTDINTMTANETLNAQTIHYAFSVDNQTTFQITKVTAGVRNIVRINGGTWQYNSNVTYASETWTAASTNDVYTALNQSAGVASNLMTGTQLAAAADADYFTLTTTFDMAAILYTTDATQIPSIQSIDVNYDAPTLYKGAILGTDYDFDQPDSTTVNFTALTANTYTVRII